MRIKPEEGMEVIASGRITTFPGKSAYQIVVEAMEPAGVGALMALLEARRVNSPPRACSTPRANGRCPFCRA